MTDIQFQEEGGIVRPPVTPKGGLYKTVINLGLAKSEAGAKTVLIIVALAALILAIVYPFVFGS